MNSSFLILTLVKNQQICTVILFYCLHFLSIYFDLRRSINACCFRVSIFHPSTDSILQADITCHALIMLLKMKANSIPKELFVSGFYLQTVSFLVSQFITTCKYEVTVRKYWPRG
jgi:hypothetical protein